MKKLLLILIGLISAGQAMAQTKKVALHHNGTTTLFTGNNGFVLAVQAAVSGDTIYLPGGFWDPATIDKRLTIYGAGHFPDSTQATGKTVITSSFSFIPGSDSSLLQGVEVSGDLHFAGGGLVSYVTINRCRFNLSVHYAPTDHITYSQNHIIVGVRGENQADFLTLRNNFFRGEAYNPPIGSIVQGALIENNIFNDQRVYWGGHSTLNSVYASLIRNNVFLNPDAGYLIGGSNNSLQNNAFVVTPSYGNNTVVNSYENIVPSTFFVNKTQGVNDFTYAEDFHLQTPAAFPGTDNTQIGIFGGTSPFKIAAVPFNPHIRTVNIAPNTDASGNLNVQIGVGAQDQ